MIGFTSYISSLSNPLTGQFTIGRGPSPEASLEDKAVFSKALKIAGKSFICI